ncbi:MAG: GNAT family N-acetyltransferase [Vicinamibacterales bacterium]
MHRILYRPVTKDDIDVVRSLAADIWREYYPAIITTEQIEYMLGLMYSPAVIGEELARGVRWELALDSAAHDHDRPVGFLSFEHDARARTIKLHKLYLVSTLHGRGVGASMLEHVIAAAGSLDAETIWLQVNKRNARAIRSYERAGFAITGQAVVDIGGGFVMDDYVMARPLSRPRLDHRRR